MKIRAFPFPDCIDFLFISKLFLILRHWIKSVGTLTIFKDDFSPVTFLASAFSDFLFAVLPFVTLHQGDTVPFLGQMGVAFLS